MNNFKYLIAPLTLLAALSTTPAAFAQAPQPPPTSAKSSPASATRAGKSDGLSRSGARDSEPAATNLINACAAAADELKATRQLVTAVESENAALKIRLQTEKQTTALLLELNETRRTETEALRLALTAKTETITAKDAVIASQDKLVETLKRKRTSPWKRLTDILIGVGITAIIK